jgi:hypothetical protein
MKKLKRTRKTKTKTKTNTNTNTKTKIKIKIKIKIKTKIKIKDESNDSGEGGSVGTPTKPGNSADAEEGKKKDGKTKVTLEFGENSGELSIPQADLKSITLQQQEIRLKKSTVLTRILSVIL